MLARQFVHTTLQRLAEPEVIGMKREYFLTANGVEHPFRKFDFDPKQPSIKPVFAAEGGSIDQVEAVALLFVARANIGRDAGSGEPVNGFAKSVVIFARSTAIGEHQKVMARDAEAGSN